MADLRKFLDKNGVSVLWKKISNEFATQKALADKGTELAGLITAEETARKAADQAHDLAIQANVDAIGTLNTNVGNVEQLSTTQKTVVTAINEVLAAVGAGGTDAKVTVTKNPDNPLQYIVTQGTANVGTIDIPKDMVVESGEVVTNPEGQAEGTYIKLVLANVAEPLFINVGTLVDIYKAKANATQVQVAIDSSTREISATIVAGSVGATELADSAVTTAKIADANVTKEKLSAAVQASLDKADAAAPQSALTAEAEARADADSALDERIADLEAAVGETGSIAEALAKVADDASKDATAKADKALAEAKADTDTKLAKYYTKTEVDTKLADYYTKTEVDNALDGKSHVEITPTTEGAKFSIDNVEILELAALTEDDIDAAIAAAAPADPEVQG